MTSRLLSGFWGAEMSESEISCHIRIRNIRIRIVIIRNIKIISESYQNQKYQNQKYQNKKSHDMSESEISEAELCLYVRISKLCRNHKYQNHKYQIHVRIRNIRIRSKSEISRSGQILKYQNHLVYGDQIMIWNKNVININIWCLNIYIRYQNTNIKDLIHYVVT